MGNWYDSEDFTRRQSKELPFGRAHSFVFTGIPVGARLANMPARGTDLSTISKLGVTGMTGFGVRVVSAQIAQNKGNTELYVTAIEPEPYAAGTNGPELKGSRKERREAYWMTGEMLFVSTARTGGGIPVPSVTYFKNLDNQVEGGSTGRVCEYLTQDKDTIPGLIFTQAHFKTAGMSDYRQAGVAKVSIRGLTNQEEMLREPSGQKRIIQGPYITPGYYPGRWRITKGEASALKKKAVIVIETAYASLNPANLLYYIDTVNAYHMTKLGLPAKTLRMLAPGATRWWKQGTLWYADYSMLYDPAAGHNNVKTILETKVACKIPLWESDGSDSGDERTVYDWLPVSVALDGTRETSVEESRTPYPEVSWSALDGMITWS